MFAPKIAKPQTKASASPTSSPAGRSSTLPAQRTWNETWCEPGGEYEHEAVVEETTARETSRGPSWDFSKITISTPGHASRPQPTRPPPPAPLPGRTQAKLVVGSVDDPLDHESDRVADQVMRMPELRAANNAVGPAYFEPRYGSATAQPVQRLLGSQGEPLANTGIRTHTGQAAAASAQSMRARAYTYGRDIVFNRDEFDPTSIGGRALIAHELGHANRQTTPASYRLAFQKQPGAPPKFFKEVEDAVTNLQGRIGTVDDLRYLRNVLELSEAVEAQNQGEAKRLTPLVAAASPSSDVPVALSEEFVNELVARTFLMGLDSEAGTLRVFFRRLAAVPSRRHPSDTKFGPDKNLWKGLVTRTVDLAKFDTASEAAASIDSLLNTFRIVCKEAKSIDFKEVEKDRKVNYAPPFYNDDTLDSYYSSLIGALRDLTVPIFHAVDTLMSAAISDLEADKGTSALGAAKTVVNMKVQPAYNVRLGDTNLFDLVVDATRSTFGAHEGKHFDYFDRSKEAKKRSITINYFDKNQMAASLSDKINPVGYIIQTRKKEIAFLEQFYVAGNRAAMGASPFKLESVDDWRNFLHQKVLELQKAGKTNDEVLTTVIKFLSDYLETFTTSTPFNIEDVIKQDSENYNKRLLPRAITGQLIEDCGVYALRTVYMLSLVKFDLNLRIRFVFLPVHVGLIITGDNLPTLIAHNNKIYRIDAATLAKERKDWAAKDPTKPTTDEQFLGEVAGSYFSPGVDMPFRLEDAPKIAKNDRREKEKLQKYYEGTVRKDKDVLADAPKAGITQFHLEYLRLNNEAKKMHNGVVVPTWNIAARKVWQQHKDGLFAELTKAREGKPNAYEAASKAYVADLDAAFKPVDDAAAVAAKSRQDVSTTLGANPSLTSATATRGFGSRVSFTFFWESQLAAHKAAALELSDIKDPAKPASITSPFGDPDGFLPPLY